MEWWREVCPKKWSLKRGWSFSWGPSHRTVKQQQRGVLQNVKKQFADFFFQWRSGPDSTAPEQKERQAGREAGVLLVTPAPCQHKGEGASRLPETSKQPLKLGLPLTPHLPIWMSLAGPRARCCACPPENRFVPYSFPATATCTAFQFHQSTAATIDWRLPYPL